MRDRGGGGGVGRWGYSPLPVSPSRGERASQSEAGGWCLGEASGEEAERLALVGRERRSVAIEVSWDAAAGGAGAVTQSLDASLSLKFFLRLERTLCYCWAVHARWAVGIVFFFLFFSLFQIPQRLGLVTRPWHLQAVPGGPPLSAPWRTYAAARSPQASSHTPPAGSRSGQRLAPKETPFTRHTT